MPPTVKVGHNRTHAQQQRGHHSISSSARAYSVSGMVRPSAFAVLDPTSGRWTPRIQIAEPSRLGASPDPFRHGARTARSIGN
jgi:hypothetical protein